MSEQDEIVVDSDEHVEAVESVEDLPLDEPPASEGDDSVHAKEVKKA